VELGAYGKEREQLIVKRIGVRPHLGRGTSKEAGQLTGARMRISRMIGQPGSETQLIGLFAYAARAGGGRIGVQDGMEVIRQVMHLDEGSRHACRLDPRPHASPGCCCGNRDCRGAHAEPPAGRVRSAGMNLMR
jgi:hypothetical protein